MKKRDLGEPTMTFHTVPATPEQVTENRERFRCVCEKIMSRIAGKPLHVEVNWHDERHRKSDT